MKLSGLSIFVASGLTVCSLLAYGAYEGYHSPENVEYRETRQEMRNTKNLDDGSTVKRYMEKHAAHTVREFTAHDGQLLCVATSANGTNRGDTIACVKIEQPQPCKASY